MLTVTRSTMGGSSCWYTHLSTDHPALLPNHLAKGSEFLFWATPVPWFQVKEAKNTLWNVNIRTSTPSNRNL